VAFPTYSVLTPWSRVLLEKLTGFQIIKKFPAFYGTRMFITVFTSSRHMSLSWVSSIQSIPPHPTSWRSILAFLNKICYSFFHVLPIYMLNSQTFTWALQQNSSESEALCNILQHNVLARQRGWYLPLHLSLWKATICWLSAVVYLVYSL